MNKTFLVTISVILGVLLSLAVVAKAQVDDYSRHPVNKKQAVKFHLALKLLEGGWNDTQKGIILKAINAPSPALEAEVAQVFAPSEAKLFYDIGSVDISDLKTVYNLAYGKGQLIKEWTAER